MISEKLIIRLDLVETREQVGNSFAYNVLVYKSGLPFLSGGNVFFAECDSDGSPTELQGTISCFCRMCVIPLSTEALENMQPDEIVSLIDNEVKNIRGHDQSK